MEHSPKYIAALALSTFTIAAAPADAAYPGSNGAIAFENTARLVSQDIFSVTAGKATNLTRTGIVDFAPAISADGEKVAFASDRRNGVTDIYVMDADGSDVRRLTGAGSDYHPYFAPNGKRVVYERYDAAANDAEIYSVGISGKNERNLTNSPNTYDAAPAYSPDGKRIVFTSGRTSSPMFGTTSNIVTMDADGSNQQVIVGKFLSNEYDPDWAPNGKRIVFASDGDLNGYPEDLFTVKPDGSKLTNISKTFGAAEDEWDPHYSPDGRRIAYLQGDSDLSDGDVYTMDTKAQNRTAVYRKGASSGPVWGPRP